MPGRESGRPHTTSGLMLFASIPPQSIETCEIVIKSVTAQLDDIRGLLGHALEVFIIDKHASNQDRETDMYWQGWKQAGEFLDDLRSHWPQLRN